MKTTNSVTQFLQWVEKMIEEREDGSFLSSTLIGRLGNTLGLIGKTIILTVLTQPRVSL